MNAYLILTLAGVGLALVVAVVALVARHLVYKHADDYAAVVAQQHQAAEHQAAVARIVAVSKQKELTR